MCCGGVAQAASVPGLLPVPGRQQPHHSFFVVWCCWSVLSAAAKGLLGWDGEVDKRGWDAVLCFPEKFPSGTQGHADTSAWDKAL